VDPGRSADIEMIFAPRKEFPAIAAREQFHYVSGHPGFFSIWWNARHEIYRAVILIDAALGPERKAHFVREELVQSLGLANDSPQFRSSIFFEKGSDGGKARAFSALDRRLILFFYRHVRPGAGREEVRRAFTQHWSSV
jgi:hypothetical protein